MGVPLGRLIEPGEIAHAILFFLSPRAAMCTGAELVVDGGILLGSAQAYEGYFRSRGRRAARLAVRSAPRSRARPGRIRVVEPGPVRSG